MIQIEEREKTCLNCLYSYKNVWKLACQKGKENVTENTTCKDWEAEKGIKNEKLS